MNELRNFSLVVVLYLFSILTSNNLYGQIKKNLTQEQINEVEKNALKRLC